MKLIIIHGPPGVGKLTVSRELVKLTGYKLLHNHLINDLLESIFEFGTPSFKKLAAEFRIDLLSTAAEQSVSGMIMTFCYAKGEDDALLKRFVTAVEKYHGTVESVLLTCNKDVLYKRVQHVSRKKFGKIKKIKVLKEVMARYELSSPIPFVKGIAIDNSELSPRKTAEKIKRELLD